MKHIKTFEAFVSEGNMVGVNKLRYKLNQLYRRKEFEKTTKYDKEIDDLSNKINSMKFKKSVDEQIVNEAGTFSNGKKFTLKINFKEAKQIVSKKAIKVLDKKAIKSYDLDLAGGWEDLNGATCVVKGGQSSFGVTLEITHPETGSKFIVEEFPKNILIK